MAGRGHFFAWDGGCILIGKHTAPIASHAHQAIQMCFGLDTPVLMRTSESTDWMEYGMALVPSRQPHSLDATRARFAAVVLVEPETRTGRALTERYLEGGIASVDVPGLDALVPALFEKWLASPDSAMVSRAVWQIIGALTGSGEPAVITDLRIERAVAYVNAHLDRPLTLNEIAGEANLSTGRFRHLFVEQTGIGLRPYILWRRFLKVWQLMMEGEKLSVAAHTAGFADSAHLSRTSRKMFGLPPSAIQILTGSQTPQ